MADYMDFLSEYVMGIAQMFAGFYFFTRFLQKKVKIFDYYLLTVCGLAITKLTSGGSVTELLIYTILLIVSGIFVCHGDLRSVILYAALTIEIMLLSYGIINSLSGMLCKFQFPWSSKTAGIVWILLGNTAALLIATFCCHMAYVYFIFYETIKKQYIFIVLIPILMIFFIVEYIKSSIYGNVIDTGKNEIAVYINHYQMFMVQLLGMASLFCIMFAYKKLLQNFCLSTELSLLEKEEDSLNRYVEEAKARYTKTQSFRHDIRNHITVIKELLHNGKSEQALNYIEDMADMTQELSFPCSTNNPVADILVGNKLGIAKNNDIDVSCSLRLPYPSLIRDIDFCIILSNALDNAIYACKNMDAGEEKYIRMSGHTQGDFILLEVENSFQGKGLPKKGTGLSNIKMVAEKYHGAMSVKTQDTIFVLSVLLINPQQSESISQQIS